MAADFPTDVLVNMLNTIEDMLEYLVWYGNIQNSIHLADRPAAFEPSQPVSSIALGRVPLTGNAACLSTRTK